MLVTAAAGRILHRRTVGRIVVVHKGRYVVTKLGQHRFERLFWRHLDVGVHLDLGHARCRHLKGHGRYGETDVHSVKKAAVYRWPGPEQADDAKDDFLVKLFSKGAKRFVVIS